jgi:hypothetical protein
MTVQEQINNLDFLSIAQQVAPVDGADVYFYAMSNENINVRKTAVGDFETWIVIYNHFDGTTVILTGAAPLTNTERYTLLQKLDNVVRPEPVVIEPVVPEVPTEE